MPQVILIHSTHICKSVHVPYILCSIPNLPHNLQLPFSINITKNLGQLVLASVSQCQLVLAIVSQCQLVLASFSTVSQCQPVLASVSQCQLMLASVSSGVVLELWCKHHLPIVTLSLDPSPPCFTDFRTLSIFTLRFFFSPSHVIMIDFCYETSVHCSVIADSILSCFLPHSFTMPLMPLFHHCPLFFSHFNSFTTAPFFWNFYARPK